MPTDEHEAFANLPEDQRKVGHRDEFLKDGQVGADGKKFDRPLRDYLAIFRACEMHRTLFADRWESARRDLGYLEAASEEAKDQEALVEKEKTQVAARNERADAELDAVTNLYAAVQRMLKLQPSGRPRRRLPRTSIRAGNCQAAERGGRSDRSPHAQHGPIRTEGKLTEWVSTIATTTAKDAAVFG